MAQARTIKYGEGLILLGDGTTPGETFTAICGFTELTQTLQINTEDTEVPDCDDPDAMVWVETDIRSQQLQLSGQGVLDRTALVMWNLWALGADAGQTKNVRWLWDLPSADGGGYYQGPGVLTNFEITGQRGQKYNVNVTIAVSGKPNFTPAV